MAQAWKVAILFNFHKELAKARVSRDKLCRMHYCNLLPIANLEYMIVYCTNFPSVLLCVLVA